MTTSINAINDGGTVTGALASYLRTMAEPNLYRNYEFVACATQAEVPNEQGIHMNIPAYANGVQGATWGDKANSLQPVTAAGGELAPILDPSGSGALDLTAFNSTSVSTIRRVMSYFATGFAVSKLYKSTATVQDEYERIAQFIMKTAAAVQEILTQSQIIYRFNSGGVSNEITDPTNVGVVWDNITAEGPAGGSPTWAGNAAPIYVAPDLVPSNWGSIPAGTKVVPNKFALARKYLKGYGNPGFSKFGGKLAALIGPDTVYALTTQVVGGPSAGSVGDASLTFENESMAMSAAYKDNQIGDFFGFRLIETTNPIVVDSANLNAPGADDCEINVLFAPDAFYVTPHSRLTPQIYVTGFDEGGPLNPTKTLSAVSTDFLFGAIRGPRYWEKMVLLPTSVS